MYYYKYFLLLLILSILFSCNLPDTNNHIETDGDSGSSYNWMKIEIKNQTDNTVDYSLSGINIKFDVSNDIRYLNQIINPSYNLFIMHLLDEDKFLQVFRQELDDRSLYRESDDSWSTLEEKEEIEKFYDPLADYYEINANTITEILSPHSSKYYYCWYLLKGTAFVSEIYSVKLDLHFTNSKITLLGWDKSLYEYDTSNDVNTLYCLDICNDNFNPDFQNGDDDLSESIRCYYFEETITINGDTTADIVVTKNYINPWNE